MDTLASNHDQEGSDQDASQASVRWGQHHFSAILFPAAQKKIAVKVNKTTNLSKSSNLLINFAKGSFTRPEDAARQNEQSQGLVR